jgi:hypothetical protein
MPTKNRTVQQTGDQKLIDGLTKHASAITALPVTGKSITPKDAIQVLLARIATANNAQLTRGPWQHAVQADRDERAQTQQFVLDLKQALRMLFAGQLDVLNDFGIAPRKKAAPKPATQAAAAIKAKATRKARGTVGPKAKLAIKGAVPATAPATPPAPLPPVIPPTKPV